MASYFSSAAPETDLEKSTPVDSANYNNGIPDGLSAIDASEKQTLVTKIDANKYPRQSQTWVFRSDFGPKEFLMRSLALGGLFFLAYTTDPGTPRGREDKEWLESFAVVMILWYVCLHALAYLPSMIFGSFGDLWSACTGQMSHALENYRDYQYCAAIIVLAMIFYPFIMFFYIIYDGFNPYDELTTAERKLEGGQTAKIVYMFRVILHLYMLLTTIYLICLMLMMYCLRQAGRYPGQYTWIAKKVSRMPYGPIFFEAGE